MVRRRLSGSSGSWLIGINLQLSDIGILLDVGAEDVPSGVEQFQAFAEVGQSDARAAAVVVRLGVVAVGDAAGDDAVGFRVHVDVDE